MPPTPQTSAPITPPRYCRRCNYNLSSLSTPRCPECAHPFNPTNPRTTLARPARRWLRVLVRTTLILFILAAIPAAAWTWLYWGWHEEQQGLDKLRYAGMCAPTREPLSP